MDILKVLTNPVASIFGTVADTVGSLVTSNKNRKFQQYLQHDAQEFTRQEREAMQDYQTNERLSAQDYNTSEREAAQQWELEQWNRTNQYNSPAAQLSRMMGAGINPNAAFGNMTSVAADSLNTQGASISPQSAASGESGVGAMPTPFDNFGAAIAEGVNNSFRNSLVQAQTEKTGAETGLTKKQVDKVIAETAKTDEERNQIKQLTPLLVGKSTAEINSINAAINLTHQKLKTEEENTRKTQNEANNAVKQGEQIEQQTAKTYYETITAKAVADLAKQGFIVDKGAFGFAASAGYSLWNRVASRVGTGNSFVSNLTGGEDPVALWKKWRSGDSSAIPGVGRFILGKNLYNMTLRRYYGD